MNILPLQPWKHFAKCIKWAIRHHVNVFPETGLDWKHFPSWITLSADFVTDCICIIRFWITEISGEIFSFCENAADLNRNKCGHASCKRFSAANWYNHYNGVLQVLTFPAAEIPTLWINTVQSAVLNYLSGAFFFSPFSAVFCFGWIAAPFFISFQDFRLVWSDSRDLYCNMGIIEEVTPLHPFLHMERERGKKKKKPSWAVNGYSQFHPAFGPVQNSCAFFLTRTHTHTHSSLSPALL